MRKRKPIGIKRASRLMHDLGLLTPEDISYQFMRLEAYGKLGQSGGRTMPNIPVIDFTLIEGTGNRCGCCHSPIKAREGIAFGRPGLLGGRVPPINVCAKCIKLAVIHLESAKEGLI